MLVILASLPLLLTDRSNVFSMRSGDDAKMGVMAHDPMLSKLSCDNIIFGCCTASSWNTRRRLKKSLLVPIRIEMVFGTVIDGNQWIVYRFSLITSLLFKNASICTWFRMLDFNSLANFALNAFFSLIIRKVSSWGAVWMLTKRGKSEHPIKNGNACDFVDKLTFLFDNVMEISILIALLSHQHCDVAKSQWDIKVKANNKTHINK